MNNLQSIEERLVELADAVSEVNAELTRHHACLAQKTLSQAFTRLKEAQLVVYQERRYRGEV